MIFVAFLLVFPVACPSDIFRFEPRQIYHNEIDGLSPRKVDKLESEYGVFMDRRPKFQTQVNRLSEDTFRNNLTEESSEADGGTKQRVNLLLKNYVSKLHAKKFDRQEYNGQQESKFFTNNWGVKNKTKHLLSLFQIVKFPNSECLASDSGGQYLGTCYHQTQCDSMNGTSVGTCADGYGVCCVFRYSCGANSSQNCTYFESPGYPDYYPPGSMVLPPTNPPPPTALPTPDPRFKYYKLHRQSRQSDTALACSINIYKQSDDIQQMRIDFIDLELEGPTNGTCVNERLVISGQGVNEQIPDICGYNTGQDVYVDVSGLTGPLQLSVLSTSVDRKRFKIRICQLANSCGNSNDCLQYYTGVTGVISSFNYDQAAMLNRSEPGYFNNLNYAICIRREAGYCSITYTNMPAGVEYPFQLVNVDQNGDSTVPPGQAGADVFNCPDDYIVIGGVRLCGDKFNDGSITEDFTMNAPVTDTSSGPIVIPVRTDGSVTGRGFKLFYTQNRCPNT